MDTTKRVDRSGALSEDAHECVFMGSVIEERDPDGTDLRCQHCGTSLAIYRTFRNDGKPNRFGRYGKWVAGKHEMAQFIKRHRHCANVREWGE